MRRRLRNGFWLRLWFVVIDLGLAYDQKVLKHFDGALQDREELLPKSWLDFCAVFFGSHVDEHERAEDLRVEVERFPADVVLPVLACIRSPRVLKHEPGLAVHHFP